MEDEPEKLVDDCHCEKCGATNDLVYVPPPVFAPLPVVSEELADVIPLINFGPVLPTN